MKVLLTWSTTVRETHKKVIEVDLIKEVELSNLLLKSGNDLARLESAGGTTHKVLPIHREVTDYQVVEL